MKGCNFPTREALSPTKVGTPTDADEVILSLGLVGTVLQCAHPTKGVTTAGTHKGNVHDYLTFQASVLTSPQP